MAKRKIQKPKALKKAIPSYSWTERADYKKENRAWLRKSANIALEILEALGKKGMNQSELAEKLGVSRQQVSKILNGQENLTLETISKLELALGLKLGRVMDK